MQIYISGWIVKGRRRRKGSLLPTEANSV
ncbi:unnamed protein product [Linum tenue]|uniref:Uncharacterized protein n=1 Tax=Linum tenue TaxID=586396 RepID=A0AAV0KN79_9ROSI|nr:unnamed protein product [Linum tenue]